MSASTPARPRHPGLSSASVMLGAFLYSMDWSIAAVALPQMQGTFSATQDQISWVITSYIVTSAIVMPTGGWLSMRFGRKRVFAWALGGFTVSSVLCGAADTLTAEVVARVIQGASGAFLIPLSQAITLDTYPPEQHGKAMAMWGAGAVMGTMLGPTVGGYVTEYMSWRYIFYINVPFGLLALLGTLVFVPETPRDPGRRLDWFGFLTLALGIGALQMLLDRGERLDWFESGEIVLLGCLGVLGLYLFAVHSVTARQPFLDPRLIASRRFFFSLLLISGYGFLTMPVMVLMPSFLEHLRGYEIDTVGLLQSPRGVGLLLALFVSGRISGKIDPRILIAFGLACLVVSSAEMSTWTMEVGQWPIVWTGFLQGVGGGIMLVPIQVTAFSALASHHRTEAAAVFNLLRSVWSSVGVSLMLTLFVRESSRVRSLLVEHITPYSQALRMAVEAGGMDPGSQHGLALIEHQIELQAAMVGYNSVFLLLAVAAAGGLPLLLLIGRPPKLKRADPETLVVGE